jgi:uncharacterized protein YfdQ (DUF2303 family)
MLLKKQFGPETNTALRMLSQSMQRRQQWTISHWIHHSAKLVSATTHADLQHLLMTAFKPLL